MTTSIENIELDIEELVEDLRLHWVERGSVSNSYAFSKLKPTSDNIMFCCPYHSETNPSAGVSRNNPYLFNCFGCGTKANILQLITHGIGFKSTLMAEHYLTKNYYVASVTERPKIDIELLLDERGQGRKVSVHEDEVKKFLAKRHSYMYNRGFNDLTLNKYEIGYCSDTNSITFPVRTSHGDVRFIKKRFVAQKGFLNQSGIDKKDIVYGLYYIIQSARRIEEIYLTESETDTMACYQSRLPSGSILGRVLFKEQVKELLKAGIKSVVLFFDNDKYGVECTLKAYKLLTKLSYIRVSVAIYPGGHYSIDNVGEQKYKDANDLMKAARMNEIEVVSADEFIARINYRDTLEFEW